MSRTLRLRGCFIPLLALCASDCHSTCILPIDTGFSALVHRWLGIFLRRGGNLRIRQRVCDMVKVLDLG